MQTGRNFPLPNHSINRKSIISVWVHFEIALGNVRSPAIMNTNMVPRLVFRRATLGHRFIPFVVTAKLEVHPNHNAPIMKTFVMNGLTDQKFCF
jgi:hypothetical protein